MDNSNSTTPLIPLGNSEGEEGVTILIVEDSPTQALLLENLLKQKNYNVKKATNGLEALKVLEQEIPAIVISDVMMPKMNGYELCQQIKGNNAWKNIPVMLLTSLCDPVDVIKGIECGADNFLVKPYPKDLLYFHIENILENKKLRKHVEGVEPQQFFFAGENYRIPMNPVQITDLLLSTYSSAIERNSQLHEANRELNIIKDELTSKNIELLRLNEELILLNQQKNQFLGMAAHDLRNPLGVIQGFSSILMETLSDNIDEDSFAMLSNINNTANFMLNLINEYLDVAVIESGKVRLELKKQDLAAFVKEVIRFNERFAAKKQIKILFHYITDFPPVAFDKNRFEQVMNNLISNAVKFSPSGTVVEISLYKIEDEAVISVKDQGIGIPSDQMGKLFGLFGRLVTKGTAGEPTTGLGLAIVKKIMTEHHGRVWVESEPGKGSTFNIALPLQVNGD